MLISLETTLALIEGADDRLGNEKHEFAVKEGDGGNGWRMRGQGGQWMRERDMVRETRKKR